MTKGKKIFISIVVILLIIVAVVYATYAYFQATANKTGDNISGNSYNESFTITATQIYKASNLIPVSETVVDTTVSKETNTCRDNDNKDTCSLYKITVNNGTSATSLNGFIRTNTSTYITNNLKYKVYTKTGTTYTAITDAESLSNNSGDSVYFKKNNTNVVTSLAANATQDYYVVFWINEKNESQNDDQEKDFSCKFGFEGTDGAQLSASFNV